MLSTELIKFLLLRKKVDEESIQVPGMEMFGPMNGYLGGDIYCVWSVTSFKIQDDKVATLRLSNDLGSETQKAKFTTRKVGKFNSPIC